MKVGSLVFCPLFLNTLTSHSAHMVQLMTVDVERVVGGELCAGVGSGGVRGREWDETEADGCGYGVQGTLTAKSVVETPPKGPLQKTLTLLILENPYILLEHPHGTTCPVFVI